MPVIEAHLVSGYGAAEKARLGRALTAAVQSVIPAAPELITIILHDLPTEDYYRGGTTRTPAPALPDPAETVRAFLKAMEARDLAAAEAFLAEGFAMTFPGGVKMTTLPALVAWAKPRYRFVRKRYEAFETVPGQPAIVWCHGALAGEWPDGAAFEGIRFVDRFEVTRGALSRQDVWNDIAEIKGQE
jgi:phenylpyruvate tautomerase PptA (4-oxalocrotonate tautomerase family)